jgi:hypothetical protein
LEAKNLNLVEAMIVLSRNPLGYGFYPEILVASGCGIESPTALIDKNRRSEYCQKL